MPKCDFNKVAKQLYWNHTSAWVFFRKFAAYFQNPFSQEHLWTAADEFWLISLNPGNEGRPNYGYFKLKAYI